MRLRAVPVAGAASDRLLWSGPGPQAWLLANEGESVTVKLELGTAAVLESSNRSQALSVQASDTGREELVAPSSPARLPAGVYTIRSEGPSTGKLVLFVSLY